ncbi:MAG: 50S ribosomal protein L15 [Actinomycetota bacterium]|nr:50S ribosomal protein L15 [Actinomycetota bacterium]
MKIHDLQPPTGSNKRSKRVARGIGGRGGKTAGRGHKGQRARSKVRVGFEGGQNPLHLRLPKLRGFNNPFRVEYQVINLDTIAEMGLSEITPQLLYERGLVRKNALVKILGRGEIGVKVTISAHAFSKSAEESITAAGGSITILPKPWGEGRPPAKGNALTNR